VYGATGSVNTVTTTNSGSIVLTGVSATSSLEPVVAGGFEIDITERIDGVSATGQVTAVTPTFNVTKAVSGVSATTTLNAPDVNINIELTGVSATSQVGEVEDQPTERIVTGVQATGSIGTVAFSNSFTVTGVVGTFSVDTLTATGVTFDFEAVKTLYDRRRTAYVEKQLPRIIYVERQSTVAERRAAA
jgi:autotransporter translocation and assembly factor TamB